MRYHILSSRIFSFIINLLVQQNKRHFHKKILKIAQVYDQKKHKYEQSRHAEFTACK